MKADIQSYRRAGNVSLLGLVIQIALGSIVLVYGILAKDHAAYSVAAFAGFGALVWLILAIVYDQHRRERVEAMEAEALANERVGTGVFDADASDFRVAAKRLQGLYKFLVPGGSVVLGLALVGAGVLLTRAGLTRLTPEGFTAPTLRGWGLGIGLGVAVIGFVFARYASGMGKQKVWLNLRAGAAGTVGTGLLSGLLAIGHFVDVAGPDGVIRVLHVVMPGLVAAIGVEILLNALLDVYRPRKPGEMPRAAFESRVLGFAAAPDTIAKSVSDAIAYQVGFDVTGSWFYRLLSRSVFVLVLLGVGIGWLMTSLVVVKPHQQGLILRFGALSREVGPGAHWKWPWPVEKLEMPEHEVRDDQGKVVSRTYTATGIRTVELGTPPTSAAGPILWTNEHSREEVFQIVQPGAAGSADGTGPRDLALIALEIPMQYAITNVRVYEQLGTSETRDELIRHAARREVMRHLAPMSVGDLLGPRRGEVAGELRSKVEAALARLNPGPDGTPMGAGITIVSLGVTGVHPPKAVAPNYERVVQAEQYYQAKIEAARADEIKELTKAVGSVALAQEIVRELDALESMREAKAPAADVRAQEFKIQGLLEEAGGASAAAIAQASADRWTRHMTERGRAARYQGQLAAFTAAPSFFQADLYFDALAAAMKDSRLYVTGDRGVHVRWQLEDRGTNIDVFDPNTSVSELAEPE